MSAKVTITNGKAEMAALQGVDVWWENDVIQAGRLQPGASISEWVQAAGMGYTFRKAKLMYAADRKGLDIRTDEDNVAIVRSDTGASMGIVGSGYNIVQPYEVLEFFRDLVDSSGFQLTTAGTLFGGRRMWALAKITDAKISGWDQIGAYLLLSTSSDGSMATEGRKTTVCVVCNNTLSMALRRDNARARVSHRVSMAMTQLRAELGLERSKEEFAAWIESANALAKAKVSDATADDFVLQLLRGAAADETLAAQVNEASIGTGDTFAQLMAGPFVPKDMEAAQRRPRGADAILELFEGAGRGATQVGRSGTAWGLVNAVTEYVDHIKPSKSDDQRVANAWWGNGDQLKAEVMSMALDQFA